MVKRPLYASSMDLFIGNISAMAYWCKTPVGIDRSTTRTSLHYLKNPITTLKALKKAAIDADSLGTAPLHIYATPSSLRRPSQQLICHLATQPFPVSAFRRLTRHVLIASPELSFLEMAASLPLPKLIEYGYLLCGTYCLDPSTTSGNNRPPLTTVAKLKSFLEAAGTRRGCALARRALGLIQEGSASPRETKTALLLCLPMKMGGYGLPRAQLNRTIEFTDRERLLFGRNATVPDLYWPQQKVALEYDGEKHHSESRALSHDRQKESNLAYRGITVLRLDKHQMSNAYQVYVVARKVARSLGRRLAEPTANQWENHRRLFAIIMRTRTLPNPMRRRPPPGTGIHRDKPRHPSPPRRTTEHSVRSKPFDAGRYRTRHSNASHLGKHELCCRTPPG